MRIELAYGKWRLELDLPDGSRVTIVEPKRGGAGGSSRRGAGCAVLPQAAAENVAITVYPSLLVGVVAGKYTIGDPSHEPLGKR